MQLLGSFDVIVDGVFERAPVTGKARSLLAYVALRRGEEVRREALMSEFWPDAEPTSARNNLKTALSAIRKIFKDAGLDPHAVVTTTREAVCWIAPVTVDSREFERCSADVAAERARALTLYRGEFIPGDYAPWAVETRDRLAARFEDLLRAELAVRGDPALAERVLQLDPFCNDAYLALIEDALRNGKRGEAKVVYRRYAAALAEIGSAPSAELAARVGVRALDESAADVGFVGRGGELAEIRAWLEDPARPSALLVAGIAGIGKSALVAEALRGRDDDVAVLDAHAASRAVLRAAAKQRVVVCARPEALPAVRETFPGVREIVLGPLGAVDVALALARRFPGEQPQHVADQVWRRSHGHPLLLQAEILRLVDERANGTAPRGEPRVPREMERRFEEQLRAAGSDAMRVAELLALEPQLDSDDLVALLDWNLERVAEARHRLAELGIAAAETPARFAFAIFADLAARSLAPGRKQQTIARIAERLTLHEHPSAKLRLAQHFVTLGRERDAAAAYLEAGRDFVAFAAWNNALDAFDAGISLLERLATSPLATAVLRELYLARGNALYQAGNFPAALRSLDSALDLSDPHKHAGLRANALVTLGNALSRLNHVEAAWSAAQHAADEARRAPDLGSELEATSLIARLLFNQARYEESIASASFGYERAMEAREWTVASALAQRAADAARRLLRFEDCYAWVRRQLQAGVLAGPVLEAQAHYGVGSVDYAVNRIDGALEHVQEALRLVAGIRRRHTLSTLPLGLIEWSCHQALAHTYALAGALEDGLAECEWLVRSPWVFNTTACTAMTLATVVDVRLAADTDDDRRAAIALTERIPPLPLDNPAAFLDRLTRARVGVLTRPPLAAAALLREAFDAIERAVTLVPDQIHFSYQRLAEAARGVDDLLAARAAEAARRHRQRVIDAAGALWAAST
ncbi:MAG TPA: winged helix-turn-helix domain-containing protein [Candidatus Limnocylindria bacterium]|nr:winged helix-turn-helix domain-containing protein [Candidatus Limnocylindria bacterium]